MQITYGKGFDVAVPQLMRQKVDALQAELLKLPQYEPDTKHYFHGGMYCREVFRHAGVLVVGKVHKKEHFYLIVSGVVAITDGEGNVEEVTGPHMFMSKPGTKRAVYAVTDALCMTFHAIGVTTVEEAEGELVEEEADCGYDPGNLIKNQPFEVLP